MARMEQIKKDSRHREQAEAVAECWSRGMQIKEWAENCWNVQEYSP